MFVVRRRLASLGLACTPGIANFILARLPLNGPDAATVVERRRSGLFLRDAAAMGSRMGRHALRVAVKEDAVNRRIIGILREALAPEIR